jgi:hypothetical protein
MDDRGRDRPWWRAPAQIASVRDYRTGLLPRVVASVEAHVWEGMHHAGW